MKALFSFYSDALKIALQSIFAHKLRAFLTLIGIIIGVASVVVVGASISGLNTYVVERVSKVLGSNHFMIARMAFHGRMSDDEFDRSWRTQHAAVIKSAPEFTRHVRRYVQCHLAVQDTPFLAAGDYDGVAELWFDDIAAMNTAFSEPRYLEVIRPDELKFVDMERTISLVTEELEIV